ESVLCSVPPAARGTRLVPRMADGELSRPIPARVQADPRHARWQGLRFDLGNPNEGNGSLWVDDRTPFRDGVRKARSEYRTPFSDDGAFPKAETRIGPTQPVCMTIPSAKLTAVRFGVPDMQASAR